MRERNVQLTYAECWHALCKMHGYDATFLNRKLWQSVRLRQKNEKLRRDEFLLYRGEYLLARERDLERKVEEEFDLIYDTLDSHCKEELKKEISSEPLPSISKVYCSPGVSRIISGSIST